VDCKLRNLPNVKRYTYRLKKAEQASLKVSRFFEGELSPTAATRPGGGNHCFNDGFAPFMAKRRRASGPLCG
jgi:hypothetical protein